MIADWHVDARNGGPDVRIGSRAAVERCGERVSITQQADYPPLQISHLLSAYNQTTGYDPAYLSGAKQGQYIVPFQKRWRVQLLDHGAQP